jgi:hypothetical protein
MAYVYIDSLEICNEDGELLNYDEETQTYEVRFSPKAAGGVSPSLYLRVALELVPKNHIEVKFVLFETNQADFEFTLGTRDKITYYRETEHLVYVYLRFQLRCRKPIGNCLFSRLQLTARDSVSNAPNSSQRIVRIKGF